MALASKQWWDWPSALLQRTPSGLRSW